ncbi:hypothetical protein MM440_01585 [Arsenicicoccus piscis]|uniref:YtxH domain-containing protein n=1 Tax=Arsenicicoccus piscis TaxID=673954 RepID=A0ABQ6HRQ6_9MICO|nr:hypothetical protein [Arsenicicoccus piscis]MCH8626507.1 hypothetical protein [Arsenicicoccus piscis]GMA21145.1 hypothetical protein GCM10025862_31660 [Arsenicicoccus piscis]
MGYKIGFLAGAGAGYVLGAKAGRQRYEQLKGQAAHAWNSPSTQSAVTNAADALKAKAPSAAHGLVDKAVEAQHRAATKADPTS